MRAIALALIGAGGLYLAAALPGPWGGGGFDLPGAWRVRRAVFGDHGALRARHRTERLRIFEQDPSPGAEVLLIGSSTIERLEPRDLWPGKSVKNRGIGDEPLGDMLVRLPAALERVRPKVVVVYPGSVDSRRGTTADGEMRPIPELVAALRSALEAELERDPGLEFVLVQPLPETHPRPGLRGRLSMLGTGYDGMARELRRVSYLPTHRPPLVDPDTGLLNATHAADRIHLGPTGCEILSGWIADVAAVGRFLR